MSRQASPAALTLVRGSDEQLLEAVVTLADQHRSTLGLMPRGAFPELADKGGLIAALDAETLAGYALFSIARGRVRLIHLCVADAYRRRGIAKRLVRLISELHPDAAGILLKCRRDYRPAMALWPTLGFTPTNEKVGRGREGKLLVLWWLSHSVPDLFTSSESDADVVVAIDHNIFIDLVVEPGRSGATESRWLGEGLLPDHVVLKVTKVSSRETIKNDDEVGRQRQLRLLSTYPMLDYDPASEDSAAARWRSAVPSIPSQDAADCEHIVSTAAGGARIFATRDDRLIRRYADHASNVFGIRIIRPSELVIHLDELANAARYQPVELRGTGYQVSQYGAGAEGELDAFLAHRIGEHKVDYHELLRDLAGDPHAQRWWVRRPSGELVAAWAFRPSSTNAHRLEVPLFRVEDSTAGATLGRLISLQLRQNTLAARKSAISVTDPALPLGLSGDLVADGYRPVQDGLEALVLDARDRDAAALILAQAQPRSGEAAEALANASTTRRVASLERTLWPLKILDSNMPSYIVPIQPRWARRLFALTDTLWPEADLLGLSREHVYYRTPRANPLAPARIAWYASSNSGDRIGAVVAVSLLVEVDVAPPNALFRRYQRLGVYGREDLARVVRRGEASALRFVDTERFRRQVPLERLRALAKGCLTSTLQSPTMISSELFGAIYDMGVQRAR